MSRTENDCAGCAGRGTVVVLGAVYPCGRCNGDGREPDLAADLETIHEAASRIDPSIDVLAELMKRDRP